MSSVLTEVYQNCFEFDFKSTAHIWFGDSRHGIRHDIFSFLLIDFLSSGHFVLTASETLELVNVAPGTCMPVFRVSSMAFRSSFGGWGIQ